jgi:hypothetical protein
MIPRRRFVSLYAGIFSLVALLFCGCDKKKSDAIVTAKEHIDIAEVMPSPTPKSSTEETKAKASQSASPEESPSREMAADEIDVDGFVMKKEVRGTSKDPRAKSEEQWRVTVEIANARQSCMILTERARYDKLKIGDRIKVRYRQGQFTGKVWFADIED